jgi:hypothetical protein
MSKSFYFILCGAWVLVALVVAVYLFVRPAPYGRHHRPGFGPVMNARLAWLLMEAPSPLGMLGFFLTGNRPANVVAQMFLGLWFLHYGYRAFVYPWLLSPASRPMPILVVASGACFNLVNAYLNGGWLFHLGPLLSEQWLGTPAFVAGTAMFIAGMVVHVVADQQLRKLRRASGGRRGVPRSRLFRRVSCPNYAGELFEWAGFALATWSPGALVFVLWTAANLLPRAFHHHRWYRAQFPDYPTERRAAIPWLF